MKKLIAAATIGATLSASFAATSAGAALIEKISHNQLTVQQTIPVSKSLTAYVVEPKEGAQKMILFTIDNQYLVAGNVVDSTGQNLTQQYTQKYVFAGVAKKALAEVGNTHWVTQGSDKAPHKAYIVIDPNCIFCHMLYKEVEPMIEKGTLQVRWIPAGFLKPSSAGKAAAIMAAKDPLAALKKDETTFDAKKEEGGIQPLDANSKDPKVQTAFDQVNANTQFFGKNGFQGTPTILYFDKDGKAGFYPGFARGEQLQQLVDQMADHY